MLKAVLFDMDDTLVDINLSAFIAVWAKDMAGLLADVARKNPLATFATFTGAVLNLNNNAREDTDTGTNRAFFNSFIEQRCGVPLDDPVIAEVFRYYEREVLPRRNDGIIAARPMEGAREALEEVASRGLRCALLTNPCFSPECIGCRMAWGDIADAPFELITTLDTSTRCKPSPTYYLEALEKLRLEPSEVLMVGNDPKRDFPTPDCGIQTAFIGGKQPVRATWAGSMAAFARSFDEIEERFLERQEHNLLELVQDVRS